MRGRAIVRSTATTGDASVPVSVASTVSVPCDALADGAADRVLDARHVDVLDLDAQIARAGGRGRAGDPDGALVGAQLDARGRETGLSDRQRRLAGRAPGVAAEVEPELADVDAGLLRADRGARGDRVALVVLALGGEIERRRRGVGACLRPLCAHVRGGEVAAGHAHGLRVAGDGRLSAGRAEAPSGEVGGERSDRRGAVHEVVTADGRVDVERAEPSRRRPPDRRRSADVRLAGERAERAEVARLRVELEPSRRLGGRRQRDLAGGGRREGRRVEAGALHRQPSAVHDQTGMCRAHVEITDAALAEVERDARVRRRRREAGAACLDRPGDVAVEGRAAEKRRRIEGVGAERDLVLLGGGRHGPVGLRRPGLARGAGVEADDAVLGAAVDVEPAKRGAGDRRRLERDRDVRRRLGERGAGPARGDRSGDVGLGAAGTEQGGEVEVPESEPRDRRRAAAPRGRAFRRGRASPDRRRA